jgi:hypothetical protein
MKALSSASRWVAARHGAGRATVSRPLTGSYGAQMLLSRHRRGAHTHWARKDRPATLHRPAGALPNP